MEILFGSGLIQGVLDITTTEVANEVVGCVSMTDTPEQLSYDPAADAGLFDELEASVRQDELRRVVRLSYHINDQAHLQNIWSMNSNAFKEGTERPEKEIRSD